MNKMNQKKYSKLYNACFTPKVHAKFTKIVKIQQNTPKVHQNI